MRIAEPDVTLTDLLLAIECLVLTWLLTGASAAPGLQFWFVVAFSSIGISALLGAILHGFLTDRKSITHTLAWRSIVLLLGITALAMWLLGSGLLLSPVAAMVVMIAVAAVLLVYVAVVISRHPPFALALAYYVPAVVFLMLGFTTAAIRDNNLVLFSGTAGMLLSLLAAWVQHKRIALKGILLDHNALYHIIQAIALLLIYWAARALVHAPPVSTV